MGLLALATLRRDEAFDFLLSLVREGAPPAACQAIEALGLFRSDGGLRRRALEAASGRDDPRIQEALARALG